MGCCGAKQKKVEAQPAPKPPQGILKKDPVRSFNIADIYNSTNPKNEVYKMLAESFKKSASPLKTREPTKLPGPKSFPVPYIKNARLGMEPPVDPFEGFKTHKYFEINLAEDYE